LKAFSPAVILRAHTKYKSGPSSENGMRRIGDVIDAEVLISTQAISFAKIVNDYPQ
jgi:hypothetical protein